MPRGLILLLTVALGLAAGEAPFLSDAEWNSARPAAPISSSSSWKSAGFGD